MEVKKKQLEFMDWEFGVFFHFGIRTFYEGHRDWDMEYMSPKKFSPQLLDCESWIRTIKEAGARYAILVCKHHDGFANWPSAYTDYSVAAAPWNNGKGDVVREYVEACRKYDIKTGLYYSPAQFGSAAMEAEEYDDYFVNQISELLTQYGKIDYLWFDGCGSENHEYDTQRIIKEIRSMQPEILIFNMWDPDTRWIGNESGVADMPHRNMVTGTAVSVRTDKTDELGEVRFLPAECDCRIRLENWFYSTQDADTLKSVDELMGMYCYSVGRGANLLLNISPDRSGRLPEADAKRLLEFGAEIKKLYQKPVASIKNAKRNGNTYSFILSEYTVIKHIIIEENMEYGECIEDFSIYAYPYSYGSPICIYRSKTVGHKHICRFYPIRTERVDIVIDNENAAHTIKEIKLY